MQRTFTIGSGCVNLTFFLVLVVTAISLVLEVCIFLYVKYRRMKRWVCIDSKRVMVKGEGS